MKTLNEILFAHHRRYPSMMMADFLKLLHQNTFGPAHFSGVVTAADAAQRIREEVKTMASTEATPMIDDIGFGYVRVSLLGVSKGAISLETLADSFVASMRESGDACDKQSLIRQRLDILVSWIEQKQIVLVENAPRRLIEHYLQSGCAPIRHSETYRRLYHPHYRVIHHSFLPDGVKT